MTAGFLIAFREGLEAFLVVGIILSYLGRCGLSKYTKWVLLGVFTGLLSALFVGFIFQVYYTGFESRVGEHYLKIGIMGVAIVILTYMIIWMTRNGRYLKGAIEKDLKKAVSTGSMLTLILMGYLAILREGFETVLFLGALYGDSMGSNAYYGGMLGLVAALLITVSIFKGMKQMPLRKFFSITGILIMFIAAGLLINMIGLMQDLHIIPVLRARLFDLSWLMIDSSDVGIFFKALFGYTDSPSLMQVVSYIAYFCLVLMFLNPPGKQFFRREVVNG